MEKREGLIVFVVVLLIGSILVISAACSNPSQTILRLHDVNNTHGEVWNYSGTTTELQCSSGLIAYYQFEDNFADTTENNTDGINNGAVFVNSKTGFGKAGEFKEAEGDYVNYGDINNEPVNEISVLLWVNTSDASTYKYFVSKINDPLSDGWAIQYYSGTIYFYVNGQASCGYTGALGLNDNQWHQIALTWESSIHKLLVYVDGEDVAVIENTDCRDRNLDSNNPLLVGAHFGSYPGFFDGKLDEVAIFNRVLSKLEIREIYNSGNGEKFCNLTITPSPPYSVEICYDTLFRVAYAGANPHNCTGTNKVVGLSNLTNAHAEVPILNDYNQVSVCYGNLNCTAKTSCNASLGEKEVVSLGNPGITSLLMTDAHLASDSSYPVKICCNNGTTQPTPPPQAYCGDGILNGVKKCDYMMAGVQYCSVPNPSLGEPGCQCITDHDDGNGHCINITSPTLYWMVNQHLINQSYVFSYVPGVVFSPTMVFDNTNLAEGTSVGFSIYEQDTGVSSIRTGANALYGNVNSNKASAIWTVSQDDLDAAGAPGEDTFEFFFNVSMGADGNISDILHVKEDNEVNCSGITTLCSQYDNATLCEQDTCHVSQVETGACANSLSSCIGTSCSCVWDSDANSGDGACKLSQASYVCDSGENPAKVGTCYYTDNPGSGCDEEGLLSYSWGANWVWAVGNSFNESKAGVEDYINVSGIWHYDPNGNYANCVAGVNTVPCPESVKLPFFGFFNIISVLSIIGLIYALAHKRKMVKE